MKKILGLFFIVIAVGALIIWRTDAFDNFESQAASEQPRITERIETIVVDEGMTYGSIMETASVTPQLSTAIFTAAENVYDLSNIRVGRPIQLVYDRATNELKKFIYQVDTEEELHVNLMQTTSTITWEATRVPIEYDVRIKRAQATIETSMYQAALDAGIDERAVIALAEVFQWSVDFAMDVRVGDTFDFIYEERFRHGQYVMPGNVLAGKYVNVETPYYGFYFEAAADNKGYFDEHGNSVQKIFLKAPVAYKYITSGFTTGLRYVQAFNVATGHRAIDYAAAAGTPVRAVGDGTVVSAGWNGPYGNFISIRHNETYTTNYAHLSRIAVKRGQKVNQSQTIGYVGSTGFSTGPHLHYEMVKFGTKINPLNETFPPGQAINQDQKNQYIEHIKPLAEQLGLQL